MPGRHFLEKPVPHPVLAKSCKGSQSYPFQAMAHLYFISSGLWLWLRWRLHRFFRKVPVTTCRERKGLIHRFQTYLTILRRWGIIETEFIGFEEAPSWQGCVIVPNHPSILDAILLVSCIPSLDCVMNTRLLRNPITAGAAHLCDFIRNDSLRLMAKLCKERLAAGSNILIFPEGTRTKTPPVDPFHPIYSLVSKYSGAPIRTILIECDSDYFGRNFSYFRPAQCPMRFRLTAGRIFHSDDSTDPRELSEEIEGYFRACLSHGETHS